MDNTDLMTGYELRLYKGLAKSNGDKLKDNRMLSTSLKKHLGIVVEKQLPTGERICVNVMDELVQARIAYEMEHPEDIDIKKWAQVLGEYKETAEVVTRTAGDLFDGIVVDAAVEVLDETER